jgi:hypothetical protein
MDTVKRLIATVEVLLVFPAALFMTALFVRNIQPQQYEPAHTAQQIVMWYAARPHVGLWILLIALPFAALIVGSTTLVRTWHADPALRRASEQVIVAIRSYFVPAIVAMATLAAGGILMVVAVHVLTD